VVCPSCRSENLPDALFCVECGSRIDQPCQTCGATNPPHSKFCRKCGKRLVDEVPAPKPASDSASAVRVLPEGPAGADALPDGERKTVTALFADIKGSMELMEDLDPEEARAIVDPALRLMIDAVHRYDGYIVQSTGDGIFALFGAPVAHEDHPQRALYAALRMQEDIRCYAEQLRSEGKPPLQVRVGANTGEAVVRSIHTGEAHAEYTPIGHSTSLAARMQVLAPIGSIAITGDMQKLVEGYFQLKSLGPTRVKGVSEPVAVFEVTGLGPLRTRLQIAARRGLTKFVGREAELAQMRRALESARAGHGQIVAAIGEPGVGKSRLFFEFKAISQSGSLVLEAYSVSHGKASAYLPVFELLRDYFRISPEDDARQRREKVIGKVLGLDRALEDALPYVFALMGIQEGDDPLAQMDGQIRRRRTQEALKRILLRESLNQPLILVFEDLHWIDSETQALFNVLADSIANTRVLLLVNYRPEYRHEWGHRTHYTQLRLDPLGGESAEEMLTALLASPAPAGSPAAANRERPLADVHVGERVRAQDGIAALKGFIIERTQGNPFFIEEIVQALFDEGVLVRNGAVKVARELSQVHLPPTVQGILAARIDRLPASEKDLLQTLAVIGREFPLGLVRSVTGAPGDEIERMLADLQLGEFIYEQPAFPDIEYKFKHALTQEVAYNSVLNERRKLFHERTGAAMESLYAARLEDHIDELAHHYSRSENVAKAVEYLRLAAAQALARSHHDEASAHATGALKLIGRLPDATHRLRAELAIRMLGAQASMATAGYGASDVQSALDRAEAICRQIGAAEVMFPVISILCTYCLARGEHRRLRELSAELVEIARREGNGTMLAEAYFHLGHSQFYQGQFAPALANVKLAISHCQPGQKVSADIDLLTIATYLAGHALWHLGYAGKALEMRDRSLERATSLNHPVSIAVAKMGSCLLRTFARHPAGKEEADALIAFSHEHGFRAYDAPALSFRSRALVEEGSLSEALASFSETVERARMSGGEMAFVHILGGVSQAYLKMADAEKGLAAISEALGVMEASGDKSAEAELYRVKGELLLMQDASKTAEAEQSLRKAIEVAHRQEAKFYELRATMSLARLLAKQGHRDEARAILADIYAWFTEGFDTADLKDAKALLDELGE
jgi:class 3 adenylate cyclase/tetratricopeptide (TPR) repeat protein